MSNLVLTRRINEVICIGDNIFITVLSMSGGQVRLAVEAPRDIRVDRLEIRERVNAEKEAQS